MGILWGWRLMRNVKARSIKTTDTLHKIIVYFFLVIFSIFFLIPILWMISTSLKSPEEIYQIVNEVVEL